MRAKASKHYKLGQKILKLGALRLLLRLCSGQNDTTIFTSVLPVVAAASGHLKQLKPSWQKQLSQVSNFSKLSMLKCDVGWLNGLNWPLFLKVAIIRKHATLNFMHVSPLTFRRLVSHIRMVWKSPNPLVATWVVEASKKCRKGMVILGTSWSCDKPWGRIHTCRLEIKQWHFRFLKNRYGHGRTGRKFLSDTPFSSLEYQYAIMKCLNLIGQCEGSK